MSTDLHVFWVIPHSCFDRDSSYIYILGNIKQKCQVTNMGMKSIIVTTYFYILLNLKWVKFKVKHCSKIQKFVDRINGNWALREITDMKRSCMHCEDYVLSCFCLPGWLPRERTAVVRTCVTTVSEHSTNHDQSCKYHFTIQDCLISCTDCDLFRVSLFGLM